MSTSPIRILLPLFLCTTASAQWSSNPAQNLAVDEQAGYSIAPQIVATGDGSTWIGWIDGSFGTQQLRVQRLDPLGVEAFPRTGLVVSAYPQSSLMPEWHMVADCNGGVVLAYTDLRSGADHDVYAYRIDASGAFLWGPDGVTLSASADFDGDPRLAVGLDCQSIVVAWRRTPNGGAGSVRLQRLDMAGVPQYVQDGLAIKGGPNDLPNSVRVVASDNGSCVVAWVHHATPSPLRTQKFDAAGNALWGPSPVDVDDGEVPSSGTNNVQLLSNGAGGAVYTWYVGAGATVNCRIQRIDAAGAELHPHNGLRVSLRADTATFTPSIALCPGSGDVIVAFAERIAGASLYGCSVQRISQAGTRLWGPEGIQLAPLDTAHDRPPQPVAFGEDAVVAWLQQFAVPTWTFGLRVARLDPVGTPVWAPSPVDASIAASAKDRLATCLDGSGVLRCVWFDARTPTGGIYAQNVDCDGSLGNTSPAGWSNYCVGAPNTVGPGAVMSASGSTALALDNFVLGCSGLPPSTNGIFFFGAVQIQVPFGNGFCCVGGTVVRFGVQTTTPAGTVQRAIQQALLPGGPIPAGATRDFQFWYRNPLAGGAGFNLSDGLAATFCP